MGSYVMNKHTGEINALREEDGNYVMDTWVTPWGEYQQAIQQAGFTRLR